MSLIVLTVFLGALNTLTSTARKDGSEAVTLLAQTVENEAQASARNLMSSSVQQGIEQARGRIEDRGNAGRQSGFAHSEFGGTGFGKSRAQSVRAFSEATDCKRFG